MKFFDRPDRRPTNAARNSERGSSLVALMALMTVMALFAMAVAPNIKQQAQRQREEEAIFRGEEVAEAIRQYAIVTGRLPTAMTDLTDGVALPGRTTKLQVLRQAAAIDPLTGKDWKIVKSRSQELVNFHRRVLSFNNGRIPDTQFQNLPVFGQELQLLTTIPPDPNADKDDPAPNDEDGDENSTAPFIGVTSRARRNSVINYYGISRYDHWVFTPLFR